jgi:hypothetical protein
MSTSPEQAAAEAKRAEITRNVGEARKLQEQQEKDSGAEDFLARLGDFNEDIRMMDPSHPFMGEGLRKFADSGQIFGEVEWLLVGGFWRTANCDVRGSKSFIGEVIYSGFLPMSIDIRGRDGIVRCPVAKLHQERCVLPLRDLGADEGMGIVQSAASKFPASKNQRKKMKHYVLRVKECVDPELCNNIRKHTFTSKPGDNWLVPELEVLYRQCCEETVVKPNVKFWSVLCYKALPKNKLCVGDLVEKAGKGKAKGEVVELDDANGTATVLLPGKRRESVKQTDLRNLGTEEVLVAGDMGVSNGSSYLSLTGYYDRDDKRFSGAGTAQLQMLGRWLELKGFDVWDLGMHMEYKGDMGASEVDRQAFVSMTKQCRDKERDLATPGGAGVDCSQLWG